MLGSISSYFNHHVALLKCENVLKRNKIIGIELDHFLLRKTRKDKNKSWRKAFETNYFARNFNFKERTRIHKILSFIHIILIIFLDFTSNSQKTCYTTIRVLKCTCDAIQCKTPVQHTIFCFAIFSHKHFHVEVVNGQMNDKNFLLILFSRNFANFIKIWTNKI